MVTYNTLSITGTSILTDTNAEPVIVTLTALSPYFDAANNVEINPRPVAATSDASGYWTLTGVLDPTPDGSGIPWKLAIQGKRSGTTKYSQDVQPAFSRGRAQDWLSLTAPPPAAGIAHASSLGRQGPQGSPGVTDAAVLAGAAVASDALTPTTLQTGSVAAAVGQLVLVDVSKAAATVALPTAPANQSTVAVKPLTSGYASPTASAPYAVTVQCGGSDTIDKTSATSVQLSTFQQTLALQYNSALKTWITVTNDMPTSQLDGRFERVVSVKAAPFNATGNGVADDTKAIQAAINYATAINAVAFFPSSGTASYRVSQLVIPPGAILEGVSSGTYPANESIAGVSTLARLGGTNSDLLSIPDGNNYCRIRDIQVDGNKNNNTTGDGIHISDGAAGQEGQIVIERCYVHDNPGHNVYLGHYRRANKVLNSVCNYAGKDGICVAGSDNTVMHNICGSNARAGINLGTSTALHWAADKGQNSSAVTHVISNDIYGNLVGINVSSGTWGSVISSNGIDRNSDEGVAVYDGTTSATIHANVFHSNSNAANDACAHIGLGVGVHGVEIAANIFAVADAGITNMASYGVSASSASTRIIGDLGIIDPKSTNHGLISAAPGVWQSPSSGSAAA